MAKAAKEREVVPGGRRSGHCFMARWNKNEAQRSRLRHAAEDVKNGDKGRGEGGQPY